LSLKPNYTPARPPPAAVAIMPSTGLLADAYARRGIRPARYASRPASTASFMARAIATGSAASAIAVFMRTPSAPSSIAIVASDAVPTPASTMRGTRACSRMIRMLFVFWMPSPEPIGAPRGMTAAAPASSSSRQHDETFTNEDARRFEQGDVVRKQRALVADDFELDPVRESHLACEPSGANGFVGRVTASRVRQDEDPLSIDVVEQRSLAAVAQVDPPDRHRHHLSARGPMRLRHDCVRRILAGADNQP
jgi:hypothetical protein